MHNFFIALIFVGLYSKAVTASVYQVAPNKKSCLDSHHSCSDFSTFLHHTQVKSNTIIYFHPGVYEMQANTTLYKILDSLSNITITSLDINQRARIICRGGFKLIWIFSSGQDIHVQNIEMIGCSAPLNFLRRNLLFSFLGTFNAPVTAIIANVTNFFLSNAWLYDPTQTVLLSYKVKENLSIERCTINGLINVTVAYPDLDYKNILNITVSYSEFFAGVKDSSQIGGITLEKQESGTQIKFVVKKSNFTGIKEMYGYLLSVSYDFCDLFDIILLDIHVNQTGIKVRCFDSDKCSAEQHQNVKVRIQNSLLTGMFSTSGLQISGPFKKKVIVFLFLNSTIIGCKSGIKLHFVESYFVNTLYENNRAASSLKNSIVYFRGKNVFSKNIGYYKSFSALLIFETQAHIEGELIITGNYGNKYSAVIARHADLYITGSMYFSENEGFYGGALSLYSQSILIIVEDGKLTFTGNHALRTGGAIYVDTAHYASTVDLTVQCFYRFTSSNYIRKILLNPGEYSKTFYFCNNTSVQGGDSIFGGSIDDCENGQGYILDKSMKFCDNYNSTSLISSNPKQLCFCDYEHTLMNCDKLKANISVIPGQSFELSVTAVGQRFGATVATVQAKFVDYYKEIKSRPEVYIEHSQKRQLVDRLCSLVRYTVYGGTAKKRTLYLSVSELADEDIQFNLENVETQKLVPAISEFSAELPLSVHIFLKECPIGYLFQDKTQSCACLQSIVKASMQCNIDKSTISKSGNQWINATKKALLIHKHCPLTYCKREKIEFSLSNPSTQCALNRAGILCGQCRGSLSHVLGSFSCKECSNIWLLLIIPVILASGILLVVSIICLNLTVAVGTINGLIFYSNVVRANNVIFFSSSQTSSVITLVGEVAIAWVNLDLGIEACFYNGLDSYAKTIFQLTFPLYICTLVGIIIVSSHYSTRASRLSGTNSVQVLSTLFLLSYSKLIRLVITVLSPTSLTIQDIHNDTSTTKLVWLYDGSLDYLQGRHILLFFIGLLILLFVSLPYTAILLFIQCLQKRSHYKWMSWVWKMKPLFDAYTGPYKNKHRHWTGILLLLRVVLFTIYAMNTTGDPSINLLATAVSMLLIFTYLVLIGNPYKSKVLASLEFFFLLNLTLLSIGSLFATHIAQGQEVITNISVLLSLLTFCGILIAHVYKSITSLTVVKRWMVGRQLSNKQEGEEDINTLRECQEHTLVTKQIVSLEDLEEPLLENTNM